MSNIAGTIKSIRDIFRKDPGLSGDAQRIEQLGWMIFLKLFDDKDKEKEILNPNTNRLSQPNCNGEIGQKMMKASQVMNSSIL
jgi:type I restriction-modification system DNA methylase subunit